MKKPTQEDQYFGEMLDYERTYNANEGRGYSYPPIVPKLLFLIASRLLISSSVLGLLLGVVAGSLFTAIFFGG